MIKLSNSAIQAFKNCRRAYELKYVMGVLPITSAEVLERGRSYHEKVEHILKDEPFDLDNPKVDAMAIAFMTHIAPRLGAIKRVEEWFEKPLPNGNIIIGRADGILPDGRIVEHKTTSAALDEAYLIGLQNDEQILTYMWAYGVNDIVYTVCKTPTLRQKQNETDEEFYLRCCAWYGEETESKVGCVDVHRSNEEIAEFESELCAISEEIEHSSLFYRCPGNCTKWGRQCEYFSICRNYDPSLTYIGFKRRDEA